MSLWFHTQKELVLHAMLGSPSQYSAIIQNDNMVIIWQCTCVICTLWQWLKVLLPLWLLVFPHLSFAMSSGGWTLCPIAPHAQANSLWKLAICHSLLSVSVAGEGISLCSTARRPISLIHHKYPPSELSRSSCIMHAEARGNGIH